MQQMLQCILKMIHRIKNLSLILYWELRFLVESIPFWIQLNQRKSPDFIIAGASKSGTTSLFKYLSKHPSIGVSRRKEPRFFNRYYWLGIKYYKTFFPLSKDAKLTGEATTSYFYNQKVPSRIFKHFPKMKIIILLRNPIYRAYSHYQMNKKDDQSESFLDALADEALGQNRFYYIESSSYTKNLKRWLAEIPAEQMKVIKSEDLFDNSKRVLTEVFHFLGVEDFDLSDYETLNKNNYSPLSQEEYDSAALYFKDDMALVERNLGINYNWRFDDD